MSLSSSGEYFMKGDSVSEGKLFGALGVPGGKLLEGG
jgi:hypothetical protein